MAIETNNYKFNKPNEDDFYDILKYGEFLDTLDDILGKKIDAVVGKVLSSNDYTNEEKVKLAGIANNANKYTHPSTHAASMITESSTRRFFTDAERTKLTNIAANANNYVHPSTHAASMITESESKRFVSDTEKEKWNGKLEPSGNAASATKLYTARSIDGVKFDGASNCIHWATCVSVGSSQAKTVSITGFTLISGAKISVRFNYENTAENPTLNVSSTGAKPIWYKNEPVKPGVIKKYSMLELVYSGSYWYIIGELTDKIKDYSSLISYPSNSFISTVKGIILKKNGNVCTMSYIDGVSTIIYNSSTHGNILANIPSDCRPAETIGFCFKTGAGGSTAGTALCYIDNQGNIIFYPEMNSNYISRGAFNVSWIVD